MLFKKLAQSLQNQIKTTAVNHLLKEVSLARWGLGHLPAWRKGHIIRDLIRGLAQVLRGGACWGQGAHCAGSDGTQLQRGRRGVRSDMLWSECAGCACICARLEEENASNKT